MSNLKKLQLRLPPEIHSWLVEYSKTENRSMNGQIVSLIQDKMQINQSNPLIPQSLAAKVPEESTREHIND